MINRLARDLLIFKDIEERHLVPGNTLNVDAFGMKQTGLIVGVEENHITVLWSSHDDHPFIPRQLLMPSGMIFYEDYKYGYTKEDDE